jgi:hypothetical protein
MSSDLTWWEKEQRKNYVKKVFPDKKEYHYYSNLRDLIKDIFGMCTVHEINKQTGMQTERVDISALCFQMQRFLDNYRHMVDNCRAEHDKDDLRVYGYIYILQAMRDDPDFMSQYRQLQDFLTERMLQHNKLTKPAEQEMPEAEIRFVLYEKPGLISRCAKPSRFLQGTACERAPWAIRHIDAPEPDIVDRVCVNNTRKDSIRNILLVKPQFRTLWSEVNAFIAGVLKISQIDKKRMIEHDYTQEYWSSNRLEDLVKKVEEQRRCLTKEELETFRLNAVGWNDNIHAIKYMYDSNNHKKPTVYKDLNGVHVINPSSPGEKVERKAIITHPDNIVDIKYQTPAIQHLALFCAFREECNSRNYRFGGNGMTLDSMYQQLKKPDAQTKIIYCDLKKLIDNFTTITELKYQDEQVQMGCLLLAKAENLDVNHIFELFKNPSQNVREWYESILKHQAEYAYTKVSQWNPMTKRFDKEM